MKNLKAIKQDLQQHYGSDTLKYGFIRQCCYSEGMSDYYKQAECYWLHDIFQTEFHNAVKKLTPDTFYIRLTVKDSKAKVVMQDYRDIVIHVREINWTTHPEGEMDFHFGWDGQRSIICLPQEN